MIERVEAEGGMAKAVAEGWPKAMIEEAAAARAGAGRPRRGRDRRRQQIPAGRGGRSSTSSRSTITRSARPDRADRDGAGGARRGRSAGPRSMRCARARGATANLLGLAVEARARARDARRNLRRDGGRVRPLRHHADPGAGHLRRRLRRRRALGQLLSTASPRSSAGSAASPGCWSPRWARTATTAAPIWSARAFADLGFDVVPGPLFQTPAGSRGAGARKATSTWSAPPASPPGTRR